MSNRLMSKARLGDGSKTNQAVCYHRGFHGFKLRKALDDPLALCKPMFIGNQDPKFGPT